jgi:uncharacterized repeat protein (TIGR03803 family)
MKNFFFSLNRLMIFIFTLFTLLVSTPAFSQCREFYGAVSGGGANNGGALFKTDENGENLTFVYNPVKKNHGNSPFGDLCEAGNGKMYGMTKYGGIENAGVLFEFDPETGDYTEKVSFGTSQGANPEGNLIQADNGKLYGMTQSGGSFNRGVIFEWDPETNVYVNKLDFNNSNGSNPHGSLVQGSNGYFYGLTFSGGLNGMGVLFKWDPETDDFRKLVHFNGNTNGSYPMGSLILAGNDKLYGMTSQGGANNAGVIFEYDLSTGFYLKKIDLDDDTKNPDGSLFQASNGKFYGMTSNGGNTGHGILFEWDLASNTLVKKVLFDGTNGEFPGTSLIQADNGMLYGLTSMGGINNAGVLFEWDPVTGNYRKKHDFEDNGRHKGGFVFGSLCKSRNGKLYGMTAYGGPAGLGTVFEWDPSNGSFKDIVSLYGDDNGRSFCGSFAEAGNGKLYGMAIDGGANDMGVLFEWDPGENRYTKKIDFNGTENGKHPTGSLTRVGDKLYGTTMSGGNSKYGVLFEYFPETNAIRKLHDFDDESGIFPIGPLTKAKNGKIYGTCETGGALHHGVIFEWDPATEMFAKRYDFPYAFNSCIQCGLTPAANGKLYGVRDNMLFEWDTENGSMVKKLDFVRERDGEAVFGPMVLAENKMYYGMTEVGGAYDKGVFFMWNPSTNVYTKIFDFDGAEHGAYPYSTLFHAGKGKIFGMTAAGGKSDVGVLFEWDYGHNIFTKKLDFGSTIGTRPTYGGLVEYGINSSSGTIFETACDKFNFNGKILTTSGTYYDTIPNAAGCDSVITLNLTLLRSSVNTVYAKACQEYNFNGRLLNTSGTYTDINPNSAGCDSITVLFLTILKPTSSNLQFTACGRFLFGNEWLTESGTYNRIIPNSAGCDSVITLHLTVSHPSTSALFVESCDTYTSPSGKFTWITSGIYTDTIPNAVGCDSIITINLKLPHRSESVIDATACREYVSPSGRFIWTIPGTYTDHIQNAAGCDSNITVNLTLFGTTSLIHPVACNSYTSPGGMYTWTSSGTYLDTIPNAAGCDSVITVDLQVDHVDAAVVQDRNVLVSNDVDAGHQWIDCDQGNTPIEGETYMTYTAYKNGRYAVVVSQGVCVDTSAVLEVVGTGIPDPSGSQVALYPNPTSGKFTINLGRVYTRAVVTITRYDGQVIRKENFRNNQKIDMDLDVLPGIYMINIATENSVSEFKIVKN